MNSIADQENGPVETSAAEMSPEKLRIRALANWEPSYPSERIDYYEEYIHRHASIAPLGWLNHGTDPTSKSRPLQEATGVGILCEDGTEAASHAVASLDDGSVCIWDVRARETNGQNHKGDFVARSAPGILSTSTSNSSSGRSLAKIKTFMTETGAVECVSIDSNARRGYFAVQNLLTEVDLFTMRTISQHPYPFPIAALSPANADIPLTVGTTNTIHVLDSRDKVRLSQETGAIRYELIGGPAASHATLEQQGPTSILHNTSNSIWAAGRFTHLLNYDRRYFPRLHGTVPSGAFIASLSMIPYAYVPRSLDLMENKSLSIRDRLSARSIPGATLLAAGAYKGKGSLELYGLSETLGVSNASSLVSNSYQNRQTVSSSKLLSVASHGASVVFSDGDGNIKWVERDGYSQIRSYNINEPKEPSFNQAQSQAQDATDLGIFSSTGSEMPGEGDIVQKIIPVNASQSTKVLAGGRVDVNNDDLLLWTGDGRIGMLSFGNECPIVAEKLHVEARNAEQMALEDAERQYSDKLRRALAQQGDEARIMRRLGMSSLF